MKNIVKLLGLFLAITVLAGCQQAAPTSTAAASMANGEFGPQPGSQGGIGSANELALGTLKLEGTTGAVTPAQAAELLPLWQVIESGSLKNEAETDAVLAQIQTQMAESQLSAVKAMAVYGWCRVR